MSARTKRRRIMNVVERHLNDLSNENFYQFDEDDIGVKNGNEALVHVNVNNSSVDVNETDLTYGNLNDNDLIYGEEIDSDQNQSDVYDSDLTDGSDKTDCFVNDKDNQNDFIENLKSWSNKYNVTLSAFSALLKLLHPHHSFLPTDARTLLCSTQASPDIQDVGDGKFLYLGLDKCLKNLMADKDCDSISLQINFDGVELHKSSSKTAWPILCKIKEFNCKPFLVAMYSGLGKPDLNVYLDKFVDECNYLKHHGLNVNGKCIAIAVDFIVCDSPARSFVRNVKYCNSSNGCDKCNINGVFYHHRMTFVENQVSPLRNDNQFVQFDEMNDYCKGPSPLQNIDGLGFISQFPLDYMHLVLLGVCNIYSLFFVIIDNFFDANEKLKAALKPGITKSDLQSDADVFNDGKRPTKSRASKSRARKLLITDFEEKDQMYGIKKENMRRPQQSTSASVLASLPSIQPPPIPELPKIPLQASLLQVEHILVPKRKINSVSQHESFEIVSLCATKHSTPQKETDGSSFQQKILFLLETIKQGNADILSRQTRHCQGCRCASERTDISVPVNLPVTCLEDLAVLETWLASSANMRHVRNILSNIGGNSAEACCRNILCRLLCKQVATHVNWAGSGDKIGIGGSNLIKLVFSAVARCGFANSETSVGECTKAWLKNAPKRFKDTC